MTAPSTKRLAAHIFPNLQTPLERTLGSLSHWLLDRACAGSGLQRTERVLVNGRVITVWEDTPDDWEPALLWRPVMELSIRVSDIKTRLINRRVR